LFTTGQYTLPRRMPSKRPLRRTTNGRIAVRWFANTYRSGSGHRLTVLTAPPAGPAMGEYHLAAASVNGVRR